MKISENEKVMIDSFDINKELKTVEMHLRNIHKNDKRIKIWEGYHATIIKKGASLEEIAFSLHELAGRIEHDTCEERNKLKWEIRDGKIVSK
jgi:hypothetical protein